MIAVEPMRTLLPQPHFIYSGRRGDWLVALGQHRDSDVVERSNWQFITEDMTRRFDDDVAIERFNHWAVGWSEALLIKPGSPAVDAANEWRAALDRYPVASDEHLSLLEADEEWCVRCDRAMAVEHPTPSCHKFRSENDASEIRFAWKHRRDA